MNAINSNTRIIDLTVGQLLDLINHSNLNQSEVEEKPKDKHLVYGIAGIAQIFNCSMTTANRIKKSGRIDEAITQKGRLIIIDADQAIELFKLSKQI